MRLWLMLTSFKVLKNCAVQFRASNLSFVGCGKVNVEVYVCNNFEVCRDYHSDLSFVDKYDTCVG